MIKIQINGKLEKFDENSIYFKKIKTIENDYFSEVASYYKVGSTKKVRGAYVPPVEYPIDEALVLAIKKDHKEIPVLEETQVIEK